MVGLAIWADGNEEGIPWGRDVGKSALSIGVGREARRVCEHGDGGPTPLHSKGGATVHFPRLVLSHTTGAGGPRRGCRGPGNGSFGVAGGGKRGAWVWFLLSVWGGVRAHSRVQGRDGRTRSAARAGARGLARTDGCYSGRCSRRVASSGREVQQGRSGVRRSGGGARLLGPGQAARSGCCRHSVQGLDGTAGVSRRVWRRAAGGSHHPAGCAWFRLVRSDLRQGAST
jgi:hypothetical protein